MTRVGIALLLALTAIGCPATGTREYESACAYYDYGSTCSVPCDASPDVPITVTVTWSDPYCCVTGRTESFSDCRCENHVVVCGSLGPRQLPSSTCEFCPGTPSGRVYEVDAATPAMRDAGVDAPARPDAALDVGDAPPTSVALTNTEPCIYRDYGSTCTVACDLAPDVVIGLGVEWTGPYCCNFAMPDNHSEGFPDCRCIDGIVLCPSSPGSPLRLPSSSCEFCPGTPSGSLRSDSGGPDAGSDAP